MQRRFRTYRPFVHSVLGGVLLDRRLNLEVAEANPSRLNVVPTEILIPLEFHFGARLKAVSHWIMILCLTHLHARLLRETELLRVRASVPYVDESVVYGRHDASVCTRVVAHLRCCRLKSSGKLLRAKTVECSSAEVLGERGNTENTRHDKRIQRHVNHTKTSSLRPRFWGLSSLCPPAAQGRVFSVDFAKADLV